MTFLESETSIDDGEPIELYEFVAPNKSYFYTSFGRDIDLSGQIYEARAIQRSNLQGTDQDDSPDMTIEIDIDAEIVNDFAFRIAEPDLQMTLRRSHANDPAKTEIIWEGAVTGISVANRKGTIRVPSLFGSALKQPVPDVFYQPQCNHALFGSRCTVSRAAFVDAQVIDTVVGVNVGLVSVGARPDQWFQGGVIQRVSDGERRLIKSQVGTSLILNYPFRDLLIGDAVEVVAGCDRLVQTCVGKFGNLINFGGHPLIPIINIFEEGLD